MTSIEEILTIANKLADQGKKPSVALIKTKLSHSVALPTIISVLKTWQHQPNYQADNNETTVINEPSNNEPSNNETLLDKEDVELMIFTALKPIKDELAQLKKLFRKIVR